MDKRKLLQQALMKYLFGIICVAVILFLPAWSLNWPNAWAYMAALFIPMLLVGVYLFICDPALLEKRLNARETESDQKKVTMAVFPIFLAGYIIPGLDRRFGWSFVPKPVVIIAFAAALAGYALYAIVMRINSYASRTVNIQHSQKLIDNGPYRIVRHPMYTATILLFVFSPLALGSWFGFLVMCVYPFLLVMRVRNEEEVLARGLEGYVEYMGRVRWRIIPYIW